MDFKSLQRRAKQLVDKRGGTDSLKADAEELRDIAKGPGASPTRPSEPATPSGIRAPKAPTHPQVAAPVPDGDTTRLCPATPKPDHPPGA